jgi:hypothetical protein
MRNLNRREVLLAISQLAMATTLAACSEAPETAAPVAATAPADTDLELLASVAYDLFPFAGLTPALYVQVGERLLQSGNPLVPEGLTQLREFSDGTSWKELDEAARTSLLASIEDTPFFGLLRATTIEVLYRSTETFALVGYGGSAIEYGGYVNRGFDEIDWLPDAATE